MVQQDTLDESAFTENQRRRISMALQEVWEQLRRELLQQQAADLTKIVTRLDGFEQKLRNWNCF